jgi:hypothetical protein
VASWVGRTADLLRVKPKAWDPGPTPWDQGESRSDLKGVPDDSTINPSDGRLLEWVGQSDGGGGIPSSNRGGKSRTESMLPAPQRQFASLRTQVLELRAGQSFCRPSLRPATKMHPDGTLLYR